MSHFLKKQSSKAKYTERAMSFQRSLFLCIYMCGCVLIYSQVGINIKEKELRLQLLPLTLLKNKMDIISLGAADFFFFAF